MIYIVKQTEKLTILCARKKNYLNQTVHTSDFLRRDMVLGKINHFYFKISAKRLKREM